VDRTTYSDGQSVKITGVITNASNQNCTALAGYAVDVRVPDGSTIRVLFVGGGAMVPGGHWPPGETYTDIGSWNDGSSPAGHYVVVWTWNASPQPQPTAQAGFDIVGS
jgi:hypothetical protein